MRIFYHTSPSEGLAHLAGLAKCVGIPAELFEVANTAAFLAVLDEKFLPPGSGVVFDVASLKAICTQNDLDRVAALISDRKVSVLLLATGIDGSTDRFLQTLTKGAVLTAASVGHATHINFPGKPGGLAGELASHSYPRQPIEAIDLTLGAVAEADCIMKLDELPSFVRVQVGKASVFVWSSFKIFDALRPLVAEKEFEDAADEYVPAIIFLRFAFGDRCWRNPMPRAGLVIDDPLLKSQYGFINFPQLLGSARKFRYRVTLAFIPWNHWRSRRKKVRMFLDHADCFSTCAHGCDHTRNEFRSTDYDDLMCRNFVARQRMERHKQRTGMPWEPLMVCPQEQYSLDGLRAFADSRQFLALVNTACMPREGSANRLRAADLLLPAQDSYFGFPIFKRHYWKDMSVFAMALFLGKPAILVEHHEFFRNGPGGVEDFASRLEQLSPKLRWESLFETVTQTHLRRRLPNGNWEIRFFTDVFHLEHEGRLACEYQLIRRVPETTTIQRVMVNGNNVVFRRDQEELTFRIRVDRPQVVKIQVEVKPVQPAKAYSFGLKYQTTVAVRRGLSEFRDNFVARNRLGFKAAKSLMTTLKQTGGD